VYWTVAYVVVTLAVLQTTYAWGGYTGHLAAATAAVWRAGAYPDAAYPGTQDAAAGLLAYALASQPGKTRWWYVYAAALCGVGVATAWPGLGVSGTVIAACAGFCLQKFETPSLLPAAAALALSWMLSWTLLGVTLTTGWRVPRGVRLELPA
jgi:hypothetical protein